MTNSRDIAKLAPLAPPPTDTTKTYNFKPGTGWVEATSGGGSAPLLLHVQDQKPQGTGGGDTLAQQAVGEYFDRVLNTILTNEVGATLSANTLTLLPGRYFLDGSACFRSVGFCRNFLVNASTGAVVLQGGSGQCSVGANVYYPVSGTFTLTASTQFKLRYSTQQAATGTGLGIADATMGIEVYADLKIWKLS